MKSRKIIEDSFKEVLVPAGRGDLKLSIELLLDIRELLEELVGMKKQESGLSKARLKREVVKLARRKNTVQ